MSRGYRDAFPVDSKSSANTVGRPEFFASPPDVFPGSDLFAEPREARIARFRRILERKMHGLSFSPYVDGQAPGTQISEEQIRARLGIIAPYTRWIRTFSCIEGNQEVPRIAHEMGLKTMVGAGLGEDPAVNETELGNAIAVARAGHADILAVGNEILLRGDMTEDELIAHIARAKAEAPGVAVGYVDAYFLFDEHPRVADACDVILINCYPFWERCPLEYSLFYMQQMVRRILPVAAGKKVIIAETGWPSHGSPYGSSIPGPDNAMNYFINACEWAEREGIELFYFSSFDESWKVGAEGDVGAYWGLWDKDGNLKYS
ncbi:MAG: glycosyl hydrolase [Gemmatimonadetes bacterium]|nr:glycosyl hydrolase [Gemmatimonadota bacterium]